MAVAALAGAAVLVAAAKLQSTKLSINGHSPMSTDSG
jgi:hypothetical protein